MNRQFAIGGTSVAPGERAVINLPVGRLYTQHDLSMPVEVVNGRHSGPRLFVTAAIHGDELNGVEIIRRLLNHSALKRLRGTLIAIPVVNVYGFLHRSRYLPDRRDLNRSFPGSDQGSLAARIAHLFMREIVAQCTHGVDLHTGAVHRDNLPQIRANVNHPETRDLAEKFGTAVVINADLRDGSLRQAADDYGIPMLLYEGGEALRFDEVAIRVGLRGILNVMRRLKMLPSATSRGNRIEPVIARGSSWIRAPESGVLRSRLALGTRVSKGEVLGRIAGPLMGTEHVVEAPAGGILIGRTHLPLVYEGDALFHVARFQRVTVAAQRMEEFHEEFADPVDGTG